MPFFLHSLKSRLLFLIFIITLPGLFAIYFQATTDRSRAIEIARDRAVTVVEHLTAEQIEIIEEAHRFLKHLSKSPQLLTPESPKCSEFLADLRNLTDNYVNLGSPRADGELLCNAYPLNHPVNVADRPYIQQAISNREFSIGNFQLDRAAQITSINFAYPVINPTNDELVGLAVAVISLDWWSKQLDSASLPKDSIAYITDADNTVIAVYPENKAQLGKPIVELQAGVQEITNNQNKIMKDNDEKLRLFVNRALITIDDNRLGSIIIGIPFEKELADINAHHMQTALYFMLFILAIIIFSIWNINKRILAPLKALNESTKQLKVGLHEDSLQLDGAAEIIDLQSNFSIMAKTRLEAEEQLKNSQAILSRHLHNTPLGSISWDNNFICLEWNKAAENIFGYPATEAIGNNIIELIVPPENKIQFIENYQLQLENSGKNSLESSNITKNGTLITCHWYNTLILDKQGSVSGIGSLVQDITADKQNQNALNRFFALPMNLHLIINFDCSILRVNETWKNALGYESEELINNNIFNFIHPEDIQKTKDEITNLESGKTTFYFENRCRTKQGDFRLITWSATASAEENTIYAIGFDITESRIAEDKLKLAAGVFTHAKEAIMITDAKKNIVDVNETFIQITGYSSSEVIGQNPSLFKSGRQSSRFYKEMWQSINESGQWTGEIWNKRKCGEIYPQLMTISSICDALGEVQHFIALFTDISAIKAHQKQLEHVAHFDVLTNLPNRTLLTDRLIQAMPLCQRHNKSLAIAFLDLDGFKAINDVHGHDIGDQLLIEIAKRMKQALRNGDTLSRVGGDEFVAILADLDNSQASEPVIARLLEATSKPIIIDSKELTVSASIGVTIYPHDNVDAEQLLRHADQAMYTAKQEGKDRYHLFDMAQDTALKHQHVRLVRIRAALQDNELVLFYQPKVNMKTGEIIGAEALIRWQHPERGLLPPAEFLPVIEHHKLTIDVGEWVINSALKQISAWQKMGINISISVNINALHLQHNNFVQRLAELLAAHPDVHPSSLELEVLETSKLGDINDIAKVMHACINLGVNFALDDFGTGYCSLTYLKQLPVNLIKIDQSFIRDMLDDPDDLSIVKGVIGLSNAFQREVIAEGVETLEHGTLLLQLGCDLAQGYGIARPMPAEEFPNWSNNWQPDETWSK